jgi:two-component system, OmpR family, sensor kinase
MTAWRRAPLWLRLVTSLLALAALALLINGLVGVRLLRGYLLGKVDEDLAHVVENPRPALFPEAVNELPTPYYLALLDAEGELLNELEPLFYDQPPPEISGLSLDDATDRDGRPFTVDATSGRGNWRAVAIASENDQTTVVLATSLADVDATVARLSSINLLVGLCVLGGLALAGYGIVRSALRRLVEMEQTAGAIARGDLSQRVVDADPATEVGRLGQALNAMLDQIETAFRGREASEARAVHSEARMRQFVADASHELRTPLTSIRGFAELYRHGAMADPSATADLLGRIEDEATRMGLLVDDLLLLARLDQQRPLAQAPVDLVALARDATDAARVVAQDRDVEMVAPVDSLLVIGDETRLRHVVTNLVDNALTHTPAGTPVEVDVRRQEHDGHDWAALEVRDHGLGLTREQAERVFERFYRTDAARSRPGGGSGLGLSIVAAIAAAHGGRAEVDTAPGEGATFRVLLPLPHDGSDEPAEPGQSEGAVEAATSPEPNGERPTGATAETPTR